MRFTLSAMAVLMMVAGAATAGGIHPQKMDKWTIVVAGDATPSERYAAEEFQSLMKRVTGFELPVVAEAHGRTHNIYIGPGAVAKAKKLNFDAVGMGEEQLRIRIGRSNIAIAGGRPRGTLYGVYEFFERHMGVRFLTYDHVYTPDPKTIKPIEQDDFTYVSPFSFRWSYYQANTEHPDFGARLRVNTVAKDEKLGGSTPQSLIGHSFYRWISPEKFGKTHPEYFALVRGERRLDLGGGGPQPCVSNPEVVDIITQGVLADLDANPNVRNIAVSQNDNDGYCHCPKCEEINQREGTPMGANLTMINAVAERVEKKYPNVKIGTLAYWYSRKAPKTVVPHKNVQIQLCSIECCGLHPIDAPNCPRNREFYEDMQAWKAICKDVWVWHYNTNFSFYDLPFPNLRAIGANVRLFRDNNAKGVFMQGNGNGGAGEMSDLRNYVMARTLWDPNLDSWTLVEEFCRLHYQESAQPILDYLVALHDNTEALHKHPNFGPVPFELGLTPEMSRKALAYFTKARELAASDAVRARVEKASIPAYKAMLLAGGATWEFDGGKLKCTLPEGYKNLLDRYVELCTKYGMTMVSEMAPLSSYVDAARKMEAMAAARLENDVWRLTVLPDFNGKVVELFHKPSGRNMLAAITHDEILRGAHDEVAIEGFKSDRYTAFAMEVQENSVKLTRTTDDDVLIERRISLSKVHPESVAFESKVTYRGSQPRPFRFKARPEFDAGTLSDDSNIICGYIKGGTWQLFSREWKGDKGPDGGLLDQAKGGAFAFFNTEGKFGMRVTYNTANVHHPTFYWRPNLGQVNLELFTPPTTLKKGESMSLTYQFQHLAEPPK